MRSASALLLPFLLGACASAPSLPKGTPDPEHEQEAARLKAETAAPLDRTQLLLDLEHAMYNYAQTLDNRGNTRADKQRLALDHFLRETVLRHYDELVAVAADGSIPANQGIAIAALGFAPIEANPRPMPLILQGLELRDKRLVDRAVFGLAVLQDPTTPPGPLMQIVDDADYSEASRTQAAWALHELQSVGCHVPEIIEFWSKVVARPPNAMPSGVLAQTVRGLGLSRDKAHAKAVAQLATHPVPWVRMMVAVALARMNAQEEIEALLAMLSPAETNANVRLYARTALRDLAGGTDRGYDVEAWRKVFDRGGDDKKQDDKK